MYVTENFLGYEELTNYSNLFRYTNTESTFLFCTKHPKGTQRFKAKYFPKM